MRKRKKRHNTYLPHQIIVGVGVIFFICLFFVIRQQNISSSQADQSLNCPSPVPGQGLQLKPCYPAVTDTPVPQDTPTKGRTVPRPVTVRYSPGTCTGTAQFKQQCCGRGEIGGACDSKPVIDLYPVTDETVSVQINIPGFITESIPQYPVNTGWRNIFAHPDGTFEYNGKTYSELFYETAQDPVTAPKSGFLVKQEDLTNTLTLITTKLGFLPSEQKEFLDYWVQRLYTLQTPYIFISLFSPEEKQKIDQVIITPKPDTFLQYIFYFKGLDSFSRVSPVSLPESIPQRNGFTALEWGGILGQ